MNLTKNIPNLIYLESIAKGYEGKTLSITDSFDLQEGPCDIYVLDIGNLCRIKLKDKEGDTCYLNEIGRKKHEPYFNQRFIDTLDDGICISIFKGTYKKGSLRFDSFVSNTTKNNPEYYITLVSSQEISEVFKSTITNDLVDQPVDLMSEINVWVKQVNDVLYGLKNMEDIDKLIGKEMFFKDFVSKFVPYLFKRFNIDIEVEDFSKTYFDFDIVDVRSNLYSLIVVTDIF